jgi:hypothetical protein
MSGTWITDLTHFLDRDGELSIYVMSRRIASQLTSIVAAVTESPSATLQETPIPCRRRPQRKACPGRIHAGFECGTPNILWSCPVCYDHGLIHHWQGTRWDKGGRAGLTQINKVTYRHGFTDDIEDEAGLQTIVLDGPTVTPDVIRAIHDNQLLGCSGVYGDPTVGDPLQIDQLEIEHAGGSSKITVYNRAIMLFATRDEFYVQMHRVCSRINTR